MRPTGEWNYQEGTVKFELNGTVILDADLSHVTEFMADTTADLVRLAFDGGTASDRKRK